MHEIINHLNHEDYRLITKDIPIKKKQAPQKNKPQVHSTPKNKPAIEKIKPQYRGKLIYAQAGTGKSTVADNETVFDSDYLLGQILGVSAETAGFFFKTLSAKQKKAFGEQYRDLIRQKVAEGKTVLTANALLLDEADIVVYNQSAEQTDERVNRGDRAINNRYSALEYHKETLDRINQLKENEKDKEYIELDEASYLAHAILSQADTADSNSSTSSRSGLADRLPGNGSQGMGSRLTQRQIIDDFLKEFGITVNHLDDYDGNIPLFDALNRAINAKSPKEITDGVGYAIAFMMQGDPEMQRIITGWYGRKGDFSTKVDLRFARKGKQSVRKLLQGLPARNMLIQEVGKQIATELRNHFGEDAEKVKAEEENKSIWNVIKNFFRILWNHVSSLERWRDNLITLGAGFEGRGFYRRYKARKQIKPFVADIIEALGREDFSRIRGPRIKEGTASKAEIVDIEKAFRENPYEVDIIRKLGQHGIALAGSASIAVEGTLYRPVENPLHDIDFNAGDESSKEKLDELLPKLFGNDRIAFVSEIKKKDGNNTVTYVTIDRPFNVKHIDDFTQEFYDKQGKLIGKKYYDAQKGGTQIEFERGIQGKILDFFVGPTQESNHGFHKVKLNGEEFLFSRSNAAMAAKILWARPKDMWDYKYFRRHKPDEENAFDEPQFAIGETKNTFTFDDGTTVETPFRLNSQQEDALRAMDAFLHSKEEFMTLSGYAGTGKTSIMQILADRIMTKGVTGIGTLHFTATTNKAAKVLKSKVSSKGFSAYTFYRAFGYRLEQDPDSAEYDVNKKKAIQINPKIEHGDVVVIDESSMIPDSIVTQLMKSAREKNIKIIFVGDSAQLNPVGQETISSVFRKGTIRNVAKLDKVERQGKNAILNEVTNLRENKPLSGVSQFNAEGKGVAYMPQGDRKSMEEIMKYYLQNIRDDEDFFRILAFTNAKVGEYNDLARSLLGYRGLPPQVGEPMVGYGNWGYLPHMPLGQIPYRLFNSESYKVIRVGERKTSNPRFSIPTGHGMVDLELEFDVIPITLENSEGYVDTFPYIDIKRNSKNRMNALAAVRYKKQLWSRYNATKNKIFLDAINQLENYLFINDDITERSETDPDKTIKLQSKVIDFGYALTVHKSQGSTFTHVLVDDVDISKARKQKKQQRGSQDPQPGTSVEDDIRASNNAADAVPIGPKRKQVQGTYQS